MSDIPDDYILTEEDMAALRALDLPDDPQLPKDEDERRRWLIRMVREQDRIYKKENRDRFYGKRRAADRQEYAARIMAEEGRPVRQYERLEDLTEEQRAARRREQNRLSQQKRRAQQKP